MGLWIRWFGYFCRILTSRNEILFVILWDLGCIVIFLMNLGVFIVISVRFERYLWKFHSSKSPYCLRSSPFGWIESKLTWGRITMFQTVSSHSNSNKVHTHHNYLWEKCNLKIKPVGNMHADRYCNSDHISKRKHFNKWKEISNILVICSQMPNVSSTFYIFCFYFCMVNRQRKGFNSERQFKTGALTIRAPSSQHRFESAS